jgi:hypothetical protein
VHGAKGAAVAAAAAVLSFWILSTAPAWAQGVATGPGAEIGSSLLDAFLAQAAGVLSMPLLLWVGMRPARIRRPWLPVLGGTVIWPFLGGHVVEDGVGTTATALFLALFAALAGALSLAGSTAGVGRDT